MDETQKKILALKKKRKALILAHYYQPKETREIADHVCDSYEMARRAAEAKEELIIVCGVLFMAETAKILNPQKTVLTPNPLAGCPMADTITPNDVAKLRAENPDAAIVCYVNSTASVKAACDICCTSSSAERIVRSLAESRVIFIPDRNLGAHIASKIPEKEIILFDGCCPVHDRISENDALEAMMAHPGAKLLAHPECRAAVLPLASYIGSTAGIIDYAIGSDDGEFIIGTEAEVARHLSELVPEKKFHPPKESFVCEDMKKTTPADVLNSLERDEHEIEIPDEEASSARRSLEKMLTPK